MDEGTGYRGPERRSGARPWAGKGQQHSRPRHRLDARLVDLSIFTHGEILVDPIYASERNFVGEPLDGYRAPRVMIMWRVAEALRRIDAKLRVHDFRLLVKDGYRPRSASRHMRRFAHSTNQPELIGVYVAAGESGHSLGHSVDLTLATLDGREVWMGSHVDEFSEHAHIAGKGRRLRPDDHMMAHQALYQRDRLPTQALRALLANSMEAGGFKPYRAEWWHYSFADALAPVLDPEAPIS